MLSPVLSSELLLLVLVTRASLASCAATNTIQLCTRHARSMACHARFMFIDNQLRLAGLVVRDPRERLISGIAEVMRVHCGDWIQWRAEHGRRMPTRSRVYPLVYVKGVACHVQVTDGAALPWHEQEHAWPLLKRLFIQDVAGGYRNKHIDPQTIYALNTPAPLDAILHLEEVRRRW